MRRPVNRRPESVRHDEEPGARHYDSFVVRLWHDPASSRFLRAEVRHVQTDLAETAVDVDPAWLLTAITGYLDVDPRHSE